MQELVFKGHDDQVLTNSLLVAEKFGKRHSDVIRSIENLLHTEDESLNAKMRLAFVSDSYQDSTGKSNPVYIMNRKGFSILVMGYNGVKALNFKNDFYDAFDEMEQKLKEHQKPLTGAEYLLQQAQLMVEQERRLKSVERRLDAMEQERDENGRLLLEAPISSEKVPEMKLRDKILQLVNNYASASNTRQQDVWHKVYSQLYYLYHISIQNYRKMRKNESKLEIAERNHFLDKIYNIISNMIREHRAA